jgi:hypothetical protein
MMFRNRFEFTDNITRFIQQMITEGEHPVGDSWHRLTEEQQFLFSLGRDENGKVVDKSKIVTNCDGIKNISGHQPGKALDLLFLSDDFTKVLPAPKKGWTYWHDVWVTKYGGGREISWDEDHFE